MKRGSALRKSHQNQRKKKYNTSMLTKGLLLAVDANSILHRAYHAYPLSLTTTDGAPVNAAYGFTSMFLDALLQFKPEYVFCAFDTKKPTFRHVSYAGYKANRPETDSELMNQLPFVYEILQALNIPIFDVEGYEADDILGTVCEKVTTERFWPISQTYVLTGDRDLFQLVNEKVQVVLPKGSFRNLEVFTEEKVYDALGVAPSQVTDLKGLMGDTSDNIPGVKGIGPKSAGDLLKKYPSLEEIYSNMGTISQENKRVAQLLVDGHESAVMSKELATIAKDAPVTFSPEAAETKVFDPSLVSKLFAKFQFKSLYPRLNRFVSMTGNQFQQQHPDQIPLPKQIENTSGDSALFRELSYSESQVISVSEMSFSERMEVLDDKFLGDEWGVVIYVAEKLYKFRIAQGRKLLPPGVSMVTFGIFHLLVAGQKATLEEITIPEGFFQKVFDVELLSYALHTGRNDYSLQQDVSQAGLGTLEQEIVTNSNAVFSLAISRLNQELAHAKAYVPVPRVSALWVNFLDVEAVGGTIPVAIAREEDLLVAFGVALMHHRGILIDTEAVAKSVTEFRQKLLKIEQEIFENVGFEFNIKSPKQLANVLFGNLNLPNARKTKTGYSTDDDVLKGLLDAHPAVEKIVAYRQIAKLLSTYMEPYLALRDSRGNLQSDADSKTQMGLFDAPPVQTVSTQEETKTSKIRVHSTFSITSTTSGRLSSSNPNLQNLPVKTEVSKVVRSFFVPEKGSKLVSIDYSQIDLRVLAHISRDKGLIEAFQHNRDIHRSTAAKIFHIPFEKVTDTQRRFAKSINFGLVYGMSSFGLAKSLGIEVAEAGKFITEYFQQFPGVKDYMNETILFAREQGYVQSLLGRRRYIAGIATNNRMRAQAAEREAINMPIQGGADDIMRLALGKVSMLPEILTGKVKLVLQVHDELVFEVAETNDEEIARYSEKIIAIMENVISLAVPLKAEAEVGISLKL